MSKAYLIARVSTDDQIEALPAQTRRLIAYAKHQNYDYKLIEISESAYSGERSQFNEVIDEIKKIKETVILVFDKVDRYNRDLHSSSSRKLDKLCNAGEVELHFPSDNLVIDKNSPATDKFRLGIGLLTAQYYSDAISDNVKRKNEQMLADGLWPGKAPFGYKNVVLEDGRKWIQVDALKARAVREAFELYSTGTSSIREISKHWKKRFGLVARGAQVDHILHNPFYYGVMRRSGELYKHAYEPLIDKKLFDAVEAVRQGYENKKHRWGGLPYRYRGLIECADCGCQITFEKKQGKYIYGHCTQSRGKHDISYVREKEFTKQLTKLFEDIQLPEHAYEKISKALQESTEDTLQRKEEQIAALKADVARYDNRLERIYDDLLDGKITESIYDKKRKEFTEAKQNKQTLLETFELSDNDDKGSVLHLLKVARDAPDLFKKANIQQTRRLFKRVLSNLELEDNQLRWELRNPFDTVLVCNKNANWLAR